MSNSEHHQQMTKGKRELNKPRSAANCSTDLVFGPDNEFVELLWENGQIVMQGQNNKQKKNPISTVLPPNPTRNGEDAVLPIPTKGGKFGTLEVVAQEFSSSTSTAAGLVQDDDLVPWLNYPFDYSLDKEYCSEFFTELTGMNRNSMSAQTNTVFSDKTATLGNSVTSTMQNCANLEQGNSLKETMLDSDLNAVCGSSRVRSGQFVQSPQFQASTQGAKCKPLDFCGSDTFRDPSQHSTPLPGSVITSHTNKAIHASAKASGPVHSGSVMNFSHFSRPAALAKNNLQSIGTATSLPMTDPFRTINKLAAAESKTVDESSVVDSNGLKQIGSSLKQMSGCNKMLSFQSQESELLSRTDMNLGDELPLQVLPCTNSEDAGCQEDLGGRNRASGQQLSRSPSFAASTALGSSDIGKAFEPLVASSSVCSDSSAGRTAEDAKHGSKRKSTEVEESGYRSEDVEEDSVGLRKPSTSKSPSAKRSRAAEVHNLSERRRRDRINEKMKALQELIPNCNKADKASMLDEAIEYLKTLQLQVQIMSMGSGMCMPPMMLPAGIRHMHAPHMAHFSPVGVGMGMGIGMGFGMGVLDMGCSSACPMIPMSPMHSPQLPCSTLSRPVTLSSIPGSMFGVPGQGLPVAMPRAPFATFSGFPAKAVSVPEASASTTMMPASGSIPPSTSKSQLHDANIASANCSNSQQIQKSQGTKGSHLQSNMASMAHQTGHSKGSAVLNTAKADSFPTSAEGSD